MKFDFFITALVESKKLSVEQAERIPAGLSLYAAVKEASALTNQVESSLVESISYFLRMPYVSLKGLKAAPGARLAYHESCFVRWGVFPTAYDPKAGIITLAVSSLEDAQRTAGIFNFLMDPSDIGFLLADGLELSSCLESEFNIHGPSPDTSETMQESGARASETVKSPLKKRMAITLPVPSQDDKAGRPVKQHAERPLPARPPKDEISDEIIKSLTSAVSLLVSAHISDEQERVAAVKARVRYCQLTATRLNLSAAQVAKIILAAWLSELSDRREVIKQFVSPFDLEEIIFAEESGRGMGIESVVLSVVMAYQNLRRDCPEESADVNLTRRALFMKWPSASKHQDLLETFLQVLVDEEFIDRLGKHVGRVVVAGDNGDGVNDIESVMDRSGYSVKSVNSIAELEAIVDANGVDLLVLCVSGEGKNQLDLCRRLRETEFGRDIPVVAVLEENSAVKGAALLRAGAEDFINRPLDLELMLLKMEKLMSIPKVRDDRTGVSGSLADMSFSDLMQVLSAGGKSMDVSVSNATEKGRIILRDGSVIHAEAGSVTGEKAFYSLMQWKDGQFSMSECHKFPEPTVTSSTMSLLMEGARIADEGATS